ncbi:MAG TPA: aminoglycoside phosphotransferase family protein [Mycobacteriales bacterium]|nr:aminoglycoside phosphotransferase family protein [Mycobacteriales bacterium]
MTQRQLDWAAAQLGSTVVEATPLLGGVEAVVHRVTLADGRDVVVRVFDNGGAWGPEHEIVALRALAGVAIPMPQLLAADGTGDQAGLPTVVLSWMPGAIDYEQSPSVVGAALEPVLRTLADVPITDDLRALPDELAYAVGKVAGPCSAKVATLPDAEELWAGLRAIAPSRDTPRTFAHGDIWTGNVLWEGGRLTGIIDWSDACLAEPARDRAPARVDLVVLHGDGAEDHVEPAPHQAFWDAWYAVTLVVMLPEWWPGYAPIHDGLTLDEAKARALRLAHRALG